MSQDKIPPKLIEAKPKYQLCEGAQAATSLGT